MDQDFADLRACIYSSTSELRRFRQLVVNAVMATDIADRQLQALRKKRWEKAFSEDGLWKLGGSTHGNDNHRKATIVFEYIIQASDVAHTMQHWQTYQKWKCLSRPATARYFAVLRTNNACLCAKSDTRSGVVGDECGILAPKIRVLRDDVDNRLPW